MMDLTSLHKIFAIIVAFSSIAGGLFYIIKERHRAEALKRLLERFPQAFDDDMRCARSKLKNYEKLDPHVKYVVAESTLNKVEVNGDYYDFLKTRSGVLYGNIPSTLVSLFIICYLLVAIPLFGYVWNTIPDALKGVSSAVDLKTSIDSYNKEYSILVQMLLLGCLPAILALAVAFIAYMAFVNTHVIARSLSILRAAGVARVTKGKIIEIVNADDDPDFKDVAP